MPVITIERPEGGTEYRIEGTGLMFHMPAADTVVLVDDAARHFLTAIDELDEFIGQRTKILGDAHLSDVGKQSKLQPFAEKLIDRHAQIWGSLEREQEAIDSTEAALLAVPALDNGHTVMGIEDSEVRSYWRGLPSAERLKLLDQMQKEPTRHTRIALALLRSPIELIDHEAQMVRTIWNERQRRASPEKATAIAVKREAIAYGRRGTAQTAGMAMAQSGMKQPAVLARLAKHTDEMARKGFGAFGFSAEQMQREVMLHRQMAGLRT